MQNVMYHRSMETMAEQPLVSLHKQQAFVEAVFKTGHDFIVNTNSGSTQPEELYAVHSKEYVDDVMSGACANGYGDRDSVKNAHSLRSCALLLKAAEIALKTGEPVCAPLQGFHHARWDHGWGYCTFNGLAYVASKLPDTPVAIIDCDAHYGDGTDHIIEMTGLKNLRNFSYERNNYSPEKLKKDLRTLEKGTLVVYQAGADAHIDDPMGDGYLDMRGLALRDKIVFEECRNNRLPVVWVLAGGYQDLGAVLKCHLQTFNICSQIYG